jgi:glycerol-3-phosphate acyltransferase PlsY
MKPYPAISLLLCILFIVFVSAMAFAQPAPSLTATAFTVSMYNHVYILALVLALSYLFGSIPFGLLITKAAGLGDIRNIGSGNIGATNVLRVGNKKLAALTLLLDGLKGAAAVFSAELILPELMPIAGLAAMFGHLFPIWLNFKGGKGVATAVGVLTALAWPVGLSVMWAWIVVAKFSRYSSLASLVSLGISPALAVLLDYSDYLWLTVSILLLIIWKHENNIKRLFAGNEPKIGNSRDPASPPV